MSRRTVDSRRFGTKPTVVAAIGVALLASACGGTKSEPSAPAPSTVAIGEPSPAGTTAGSDASGAPATPSGTLLVADFGADTVTFIDPDKGPVDSVTVGTAPYGLAVGEDGRAWVATAEGVAVVDTRVRERLALIPYETGDLGEATYGEYRGGGMGIALAPDGKQVYVGVNRPGGNGALEVIDTETLKVTGTADTGRRPFDVDVSADGRQVYATDHDSFDITVVDARSLDTRRIEVAPYGTEGGLGSWLKPHYTAVRPSDGKLLVPFEGEKLVVVDPVSGKQTIEKMTANTHQHGAQITPDGTLFVVGTGPITGSDEEASLTIRTAAGKEKVVPLDGPHEDVAISEDGRTAYVTGGFTRDGYWDGITVVDTRSGTTEKLEGGHRPLGIAIL